MNIIGIGPGHDSGISVVTDGSLVFAVNEERFNRKKLYSGFPEKSLDYVLNNIVSAEHVDLVVFERKLSIGTPGYDYSELDPFFLFWDMANYANISKFMMGSELSVKKMLYFLRKPFSSYNKRAKGILKQLRLNTPVVLSDHHFSHASGAYYFSGFNEAIIITMDGSGDGYSSKVYYAENNKIREIGRTTMYHSIAIYYSYITAILGFMPSRHEGKVMGLAAYGQYNSVIYDTLKSRIRWDEKKGNFINRGYTHKKEIAWLAKQLKDFKREDIAFAIQNLIEDQVFFYVDLIIKQYVKNQNKKKVNIAVGGGLFANVKLNQKIAHHPIIKKYFVFPHMGDGGNSAGAAMGLFFNRMKRKAYFAKALETIYMGQEYTDYEIEKELRRFNIPYQYSESIELDTAMLLAQKKIVARFNGKMEYGPRALGNRSILFHAKDRSVNDWLNKKLKRNEFMPFAPVTRLEDSNAFFQDYSPKTDLCGKYMTMAYDTTSLFQIEAPAAIHLDNTARPQVLCQEDNRSYFSILNHYIELTGQKVLINTSFNMHEEPIVMTPADAIRAFLSSKIDALAIGSYLCQYSE